METLIHFFHKQQVFTKSKLKHPRLHPVFAEIQVEAIDSCTQRRVEEAVGPVLNKWCKHGCSLFPKQGQRQCRPGRCWHQGHS